MPHGLIRSDNFNRYSLSGWLLPFLVLSNPIQPTVYQVLHIQETPTQLSTSVSAWNTVIWNYVVLSPSDINPSVTAVVEQEFLEAPGEKKH